MAFWSKPFQSWFNKTTPSQAAEIQEDILVISDIHLGEDILTEGPEHLHGYIRTLNRELAAFVEYHADHAPVAGRRWHLVINGDMFDFVKMSLQPEPEDKLFVQWARSGAPVEPMTVNTPENVIYKLERILEIHRPFFKQLARLLAEGHRVSIVQGNHDAEVYFEGVQEKLRAWLLEQASRIFTQKFPKQVFDQDDASGRFGIHEWFVAEAGRYHIEHGHQYDEYCSFEYHLAPLDNKEARILATPYTHRLIPYFGELLGDFSTHGIDRWGVLDYFRLAINVGPKMLFIMASLYARLAFELVGSAGERRRKELFDLAEEHRRCLKLYAKQSAYPLKLVERLDALKASPAELSVWRIMHGLYVDRVLVGGLALVLGIGSLFLAMPYMLYALGFVFLSFGVANLFLARSRSVDVNTVLRESAGRIARISQSPLVMFGHSHHPEVVDLKKHHGVDFEGCTSAHYINSGSWVTREILLGESGVGMTYIQLKGDVASLMRWRGQAQVPVVVDSPRHQKEKTESEMNAEAIAVAVS